MKLLTRAALVAVVLSLAVHACSSSSPAAAPSPATSGLEAVALSADFTALSAAGKTAQLTATGVMTNGTMQDVTATCTNWQSTNASALTVSSGGMLTAQSSSGSAMISTTCQGIAARDLVTLNPPPAMPPSQPSPPGGPAPASCTSPPYAFDPPPNESICRGKDGRFAFTACCSK